MSAVSSNTQSLVRQMTDSPSEWRELELRGVGKLCLVKHRAGTLTQV